MSEIDRRCSIIRNEAAEIRDRLMIAEIIGSLTMGEVYLLNAQRDLETALVAVGELLTKIHERRKGNVSPNL